MERRGRKTLGSEEEKWRRVEKFRGEEGKMEREGGKNGEIRRKNGGRKRKNGVRKRTSME